MDIIVMVLLDIVNCLTKRLIICFFRLFQGFWLRDNWKRDLQEICLLIKLLIKWKLLTKWSGGNIKKSWMDSVFCSTIHYIKVLSRKWKMTTIKKLIYSINHNSKINHQLRISQHLKISQRLKMSRQKINQKFKSE